MIHRTKISRDLATIHLMGTGTGIGILVLSTIVGKARDKWCRSFSTSPKSNAINPNDGRNLDNTQEIADEYRHDKEGINNYFLNKKESISRDYREDSNSAASGGVQASELGNWLEEKNQMLEELDSQQNDAMDLASIYSSSSESSEEDTEFAPSSHVSEDVQEHDSPNPSGERSPQDSSDVVRTDFSPLDDIGED